MPLSLCFSNRLEPLRDALLDALAAEQPDVYTLQRVVVPSLGVRRHIELACADRFGLCTGIDFPFLGQWLWQELARMRPTFAASPLEPARTAWVLWQLLGDTARAGRHPVARGWLGGADARMRFELAEALAAHFDALLTYRPHWLEAWRLGRTVPFDDAESRAMAAWLAELWQALVRHVDLPGQHPFLELLHSDAPLPPDDTPIHLFALPQLAPLHLALLRRLALARDIRLYLVNPCREFWFDLVDARRLSWLAARGRAAYLDTGQRLLAAWGRQTQAQLGLLFDDDGDLHETGSVFVEPGAGTLLARLQQAVLDATDIAPGSHALAPGDRSLEGHAAHSLSRQLDVLHDRLLDLFATPGAPGADEVLVVVPDLEAAGPLIDAVFGTAAADRALPYTVTGRATRHTNAVAAVLLQALDLFTGRCPASAVFDLLQAPPVAERLNLDLQQADTLRDWIAAAGIRWGVDAAHRAALDLPAVPHASFADGLERLLLAHAMGADAMFLDHAGAADPEGQAAQALGALAQVVGLLRDGQHFCRGAHPATLWRSRCAGWLDALVAPGFTWAEARRELDTVLAALGEDMAAQGDPVPGDVFAHALRGRLSQPARGGVPSGAITFAALGTLRHLPYRVIVALGLDDGVFPPSPRNPEFDLTARAPERGDRQRRDEARNVFLDLLLAAREHFWVFWTGRSQRDNSALPPSPLVADLFDAAADACGLDLHRPAARARLIVEHPLQPFSETVFARDADPRRRSHRADLAAAVAAQRRAGADSPPPGTDMALPAPPGQDVPEDDDTPSPAADEPPFFTAPLPPVAPHALDADTLATFFRNPCRALLHTRLGLRLPRADPALADEEAFLPEFDGRAALAARLLPARRAGASATGLLQLAQAGTEFPAGRLGTACLRDELRLFERYAATLIAAESPPVQAPLAYAITLDAPAPGWSLAGALTGLRSTGLLRARYDDLRPADRLVAWIDHLVLCAVAPAGVDCSTTVLARDGCWRLTPVATDTARAMLAGLLALYARGLCAPLHCFPKAGWAYVEEGGSLEAAQAKWVNRQNPAWGESHDPAYRLALRGVADPLDAGFETAARTVFGPIADHLQVAP